MTVGSPLAGGQTAGSGDGCLAAWPKRLPAGHAASFNNTIKKQRRGGAIGNSLTEKLGKLLMKRFFKKF